MLKRMGLVQYVISSKLYIQHFDHHLCIYRISFCSVLTSGSDCSIILSMPVKLLQK